MEAEPRCQDDDEPSTPPIAPRPRSNDENTLRELADMAVIATTAAQQLEVAAKSLRELGELALRLKDRLAARG